MRATARLRVRIFALVLAGALLVALGVSLLLANTVNQRNRAGSDQRLGTDLAGVIAVERLSVDAETGLRGYIITGRSLFLAPLQVARARLPGAVSGLLASDRSVGANRSEALALINATERYFSSYLPSVLALVARAPRLARSYGVTLEGKREVDLIRSLTSALERSIAARTAASERASRRAANRAVDEAVAVLVLLTVLTLLLGGYLGRLAVQRDRARQRSESTSRVLQQSILPISMPDLPDIDLAIRFSPAADGELVGGDFYDVFAHRPGLWSVVVGDVCGKGSEAAAVTAMARWTLRSLAGSELGPGAALDFLNDAMLRQDLGGRFITVAHVMIALQPEQAEVTIACAGHPPPVFVPADGKPEVVTASGDLLGVWPAIRLRGAELTLCSGDSLVLYTDGVTDQGPGSREPPAEALSRAGPGAGADELADALLSLARRDPGPARDDVAVLVLRYRGEPGSPEQRTAPAAATADR